MGVGEDQRQQAADGRHGHVGQNQGHPFEGLEHGVEDHADYHDGDGQDHHEAAGRALLAFVFADPFQAVARGQLDLFRDLRHRLFHGAAKIADRDAVLDGDVAGITFAIDFGSAVEHLDLTKLGEGDALAGRREQADILDGLAGIAVRGLVAHHQVIALLALQNLADGLPADGGFDGVLHVGHFDVQAGVLRAIDMEFHVGLADHAEEAEIGDARNGAHDADDFVAFGFQSLQVLAINLDGELTLDAADGFFHVVGNGLRIVPESAGDFLQLAIHGRNEGFLILLEDGTPLVFGFEIDEIFGVEEAGGVGAVVRAAHPADHLGDFREPGQDNARGVHHPLPFGGPGGGRQGGAGPDRAFIEVRQELGADDAAEEQVCRESQRGGGGGNRGPAQANGQAKRGTVGARDPFHGGVVPLLYVLSEQETGKHRRNGHGENQRAQQSEGNGPRHRFEEAAFHALQGEDGDVGGDDDADGIDYRALHFVRGVAHRIEAIGGRRPGTAEVADDVFDHHHGAFHHHAEIQRAERKQVGRNVIQVEADGREQQGKRNGERHDQRSTRIAQEHEKDQGHQDDAFGEVVQHRVSGEVNQDAAVEERHNFHAGGQDVIVELVHLFMDRVEGFVGVGAFAKQHDAFHHVAVIDHFAIGAVDGLADLAEADLGALRDGGDIGDANGRAVLRLDDGLFDVANGLELAYGADRS